MPEPRTRVDALMAARGAAAAGGRGRGFTFTDGHNEPVFLSFAALADEALLVAGRLHGKGLKAGDRVAIVLPDPREFVISFFGCIAGGLVPVPMYPPLSLGKLDAYMESASRIIGAGGARALITSEQLSSLLWGLVGKAGLRDLYTLAKLDGGALADLPTVAPDDMCFLQFTSGSTSDPKGVVVTHANLLANTRCSAVDGANLDPEVDRLVSWLPLYHDMGLIGFVVAPVVLGVATWLIPTLSFVKQPNLWMDTVDKVGGTVTFGPNFAFALAARRATEAHLARWKLSQLRLVGCGAEPVQPETLRVFTKTFAACGLPASAPLPAYGMAEATLAVSFKPRDDVFRTVRFDALHFCETSEVVAVPDTFDGPVQELVSCGRSFPLHTVRVISEDGTPVPEGVEGQVFVTGPSVTAGYYLNPEATASVFVDGGVRTGDLGFLLDGELYISGRQKDLLILNGRNYHPQTVEWEAGEVPGVRKGNVVAFSRPGPNTEELVVVVERGREAPPDATLAESVASRVRDALGLPVADVVVVDAGSLPKTSSGKLQRRKTRDQYLAGILGREGVRTAGTGAERITAAKHLARSLFARVKHGVGKVVGSDE